MKSYEKPQDDAGYEALTETWLDGKLRPDDVSPGTKPDGLLINPEALSDLQRWSRGEAGQDSDEEARDTLKDSIYPGWTSEDFGKLAKAVEARLQAEHPGKLEAFRKQQNAA